MKHYMFDTNIFNHISGDELGLFKGKAKVVVTHIQPDELNNTTDPERRDELLDVFEFLTDVEVPSESFVLDVSRLDKAKLSESSVVATESAVWGVSKWSQAKYAAKSGLYEAIKDELDKVEKKPNNIQDALIADTAIKKSYTLVTHDSALFKVVTKFGGAVANLPQVLKELQG